jgi:signal transduction histidine kinase
MGHEFRTPLNSILGFAQLLAEGRGALDQRQQRYVHNIMSSGHHLLGLINDLLDLTKVQSGQMELQIVAVDLGVALDETATKTRPLATAAGLRFTVHPSDGLRVRADRRRFDQVMLNLMGNAIKFTPAGGSIELEARRAGRMVEVAVRDTGIGIPDEHQQRIFDEFTQVDSQTSLGQAGSGLGLALTQQLVRVMGGRVRVASTPGQGSTFTVSLPVA